MKTLEMLRMHSKLSLSSFKKKSILVEGQIKEKTCSMYKNKPLETMKSFTMHLEGVKWWRVYYAL